MNSELNDNLHIIESIIGYTFIDKRLLINAFTHPSYTNEHKYSDDYQRLEFLGDAILDYLVADRLFSVFPDAKEGELTKRRAYIVSAKTLAGIIDSYELIKFMRIGSGRTAESILCSEKVKCDLYESIIGAIALDQNGDLNVVKNIFWEKAEKFLTFMPIDYKSKFLEHCAKQHDKSSIDTTAIICADGEQKFRCVLSVNGIEKFFAEGKNKHLAETAACKLFYENIISPKN